MSSSLAPQQPAMTGETRALALMPTSIDQAIQLSEVMAKANLVPEHLRGKPGDCLLIVMQAQRWGMDAVSVAQCTSVVHGKLCYEGKLVAAALYSMGAIEGRLEYDIQGTGQNASITVTATPRGGRGPQLVRGTVKDWRTYGKDKTGARIDNAWDKIPEDMLVYRGTRQWARRYAPEALLGVYTPDEMEDHTADVRVVAHVPEGESGPGSYPVDLFEKNLAGWTAAIHAGKSTSDRIIAMVETKGALTDEQKKRIRAAESAAATEVSQ
ncbi:recombinase RecT [Stenotrophomonas sp. C3(2023)]|uniref:recombinase RecT n=1 Tax=Stenotrophomonas sp. C3(2023) TaxID=3080277 RepID=UPI00293C1E4D|nr:recombinase RecT [Stenotrophomonas sp. C3(2023)]MDV3469047.1 recombinase RecT [Stenotrophomonas sp. C3(2023)]